MDKELLFSLDIGTRSVIGIVAEKTGKTIKIIASERKEHHTRAMLDGQIHDVPEVAAVLADVKEMLEKKVGPLKEAAVAAAGRALYTITAESEINVSEILTIDDEHSLDYIAIQKAQKKLAVSNTIDDPTLYYCVGYSTVSYSLDGIRLKTLVGQRGKKAKATVIATFLPRQVIDSMQSALQEAQLGMKALTLEPIAAINVLIPPTMRHLNLVLVDIGAGTSDVAITKNGSVVAYGMVPVAGDEITEAISQKYLLDFNIAENLKRRLQDHSSVGNRIKKLTFNDILGIEYKKTAKEIITDISDNISQLAQSIAAQILSLNGEAPQAVLLVGGGSLTPLLPETLAAALDIPQQRVAVRTPESVEGMAEIPSILRHPDCVTPLGILNVASQQSLNFINVTVNNQEHHLFNISKLCISDALLASGIGMTKLGGKPGMGITVTINGKATFLPGKMGRPAQITCNDKPAKLTDQLTNGDKIHVVKGIDGAEPDIKLSDIVALPQPLSITVNEEDFTIDAEMLLNGKSATASQKLSDRDEVAFKQLSSLGEILTSIGYNPEKRHFSYVINGVPGYFDTFAQLTINEADADMKDTVEDGDRIACIEPKAPHIGDLIGISDLQTSILVHFNGNDCRIPTAVCELTMNDIPVSPNTPIRDNANIHYTFKQKEQVIVSDVLLAANFQPPSAFSNVTIELKLNDETAEYTAPVKNGDKIEVVIKPADTTPLTSAL